MWLKKLFRALTQKERIAVVLASVGVIVSLVVVVSIMITKATKSIPTAGGQYVEGIVGQPEYVNPVLASSPTDADLVRLVYQNLYSISNSITASPNLMTWTVHLKDGLRWQDGKPLTANDVVFTVQSIQNKDANSPLYASWQNVQVKELSQLEVQFTLSAPYAFFKNNLKNLYILPQHLFANTPPGNWYLSDYNLRPVGSGPYKFVSYNKDSDGFITSYNLTAWNGAATTASTTKPLIKNFDFRFFNDSNALVQSFNAGQINGIGGASNEELAMIDRPYRLHSWRTSSDYAVFFNTSNNLALQDPVVRKALSMAIDRNNLVSQVFSLSGAASAATNTIVGAVPSSGPIPPGAPYYSSSSVVAGMDAGLTGMVNTSSSNGNVATYASTPGGDAAMAASLLSQDGWAMSTSTGFRAKPIGKSIIPLSITLTVPNISFLQSTANYLENVWQSIGVQVNIVTESPNDIMANTIKNRSYEALLFGEALGPSSDLYSFWDSSQKFYPGLNLAIFGSSKVDRLIEGARATGSSSITTADFAKAQEDIVASTPAIFLFSPNYLYAAGPSVQGVSTTHMLANPANRFLGVGRWYLNTSRVLK